MKQYDSYKDSGVQWIGKIPSHWEVAAISYFTTSRSGGTPDRQKKEYWENGTIPWMSSGEINKEFVYDTDEYITELGSLCSSSKILPINSVMIALNGQGKTKGMTAVLKISAACNQSLCAFSCDKRLNYMYLFYNFKAMYKYLRSQAGDDTRDGLAASFVKKQRITIPPMEEQITVVEYLKNKCEEIDNAIVTQEKRIDLLGELRQNIITHAVTRGINPDAPLKDSGVEWIGKVPEHWEIKRIKHVINLLTDYDANGSFADIAKNCKVNEGEPYAWMVRATDLENKRYGIVDGNNYCDLSTYKYLAKSSLRANDILIAKRGDIGKTYLVPQCDDPMTLAPNTYLLLTKKDIIDNTFFFSYLQSSGGVENLRILNKSTTLGALYKDDVKAMQIPVPPLSEQEEIVSYIETKTARLDKSIEKAEHQIELLQELKQSIITEVVTGKRKVVA